jgi:hypothetical protein
MADLDAVFRDLTALLVPGGSVFLSVPNSEATAVQEDLTGFCDMPPNHVGGWNPVAIARAATRRGFEVVATDMQPIDAFATARQLAMYTVNARSMRPGTLDSSVNGIRWRPPRGVIKLAMAVARMPAMIARRDRFRPLAVWAHLRAPTGDPVHGAPASTV